jgi:hypothetical protein
MAFLLIRDFLQRVYLIESDLPFVEAGMRLLNRSRIRRGPEPLAICHFSFRDLPVIPIAADESRTERGLLSATSLML